MQSVSVKGRPDRPPLHDSRQRRASHQNRVGTAALTYNQTLSLNTRGKIISAEALAELAEHRRLCVVRGYFDPLLPEAVRWIEQMKADELAVVVDTPPDPLLPLSARAELVCGLRAVRYVVAPEPGEMPALRCNAAVIPEGRDEFMAYVRKRAGKETR